MIYVFDDVYPFTDTGGSEKGEIKLFKKLQLLEEGSFFKPSIVEIFTSEAKFGNSKKG